MTFLDELKKQTTKSTTLNGANTFSSSLNANVDLFAIGGALRNRQNDVPGLFAKAYKEDKNIALRNLTFIRDIRNGGLGERSTFRQGLATLMHIDTPTFNNYIKYVSTFGRWDDAVLMMYEAYHTHNKEALDAIALVVKEQFLKDIQQMSDREPISLLAKWLPSVSTSNDKKREVANIFLNLYLPGWTKKNYRKKLSEMRRYLDIVEIKLVEQDYESIDFSRLPSRALFRYRHIFKTHMGEEFDKFLGDVKSGKVKLNAENVYPYEVVAQYINILQEEGYYYDVTMYRGTSNYKLEPILELEATWDALPDVLPDGSNFNALVVADISGSMLGNPLAVAISLGLYSSERLGGAFKDHFITFSSRPQLMHIPSVLPLSYRVQEAMTADWGFSTNIEAVFRLILDTAIKNDMSPKEMPKQLVIISDMEFDACADNASDTVFEQMRHLFEKEGYTLPELVFWNVDSKQSNIPVRYNDQGVALVSGLTPNLFTQIANNIIGTPEQFMMDVLANDFYSFIDECIV